jgi:tripartite ATP-independent transporter DctM subunit
MIEPSALLLILFFLTLAGALMAGFPVAFTLAGTSLAIAGLSLLLGQMGVEDIAINWNFVALIPDRIFGTMNSEILLAVPLFVAMGVMLEKTRVAEDLLDSMGTLFGQLKGGLGISVAIVGALLAASTGIVGATVVTMGLISLPTMLKRGYDPSLATGTIAASGTLGQIIPPSIVLVLLGDVLNSAYQTAQLNMGKFSPESLSVGELFAGALIPGIGLVVLYILYLIGMAFFKPETCPPMPLNENEENGVNITKLLSALLPPIILILAVLGSILLGVATPTEAAAVGAVGAILLGAFRLNNNCQVAIGAGIIAFIMLLLIAGLGEGIIPKEGFFKGFMSSLNIGFLLVFIFGLYKALRKIHLLNILSKVLTTTLKINTMVFTILIGAAMFALIFRGLGGDEYVEGVLNNLSGGKIAALVVVMVVMFLLGFFLDFIEIIFVVVPIVAPVLLAMGIDPVWLGVMIAINLQTSFLTPPFGFALFYLRGVAPDSIKTSEIYKGVIPFVIIQILMLGILGFFPEIVTWLPQKIFG